MVIITVMFLRPDGTVYSGFFKDGQPLDNLDEKWFKNIFLTL